MSGPSLLCRPRSRMRAALLFACAVLVTAKYYAPDDDDLPSDSRPAHGTGAGTAAHAPDDDDMPATTAPPQSPQALSMALTAFHEADAKESETAKNAAKTSPVLSKIVTLSMSGSSLKD